MVDTPTPPAIHLNGNGTPHANGDPTQNGGAKEPKFASGLILPPPEIKCESSYMFFCVIHVADDHCYPPS